MVGFRSWLALLVAIGGAGTACGENWPQFRGPSASGVPAESSLPSEWGEEQNVAWKVKLPGVAWSQPIVWGDKIFVTTAVSENQPKPAVGGGGGGGGGGRGGFGGGGERRGRGDQPDQARRDDNSKEGSSPEGKAEGKDADAEEDRPRRGPGGLNRGAGRGGPGGGRGMGRGGAPPDAVYQWVVLCLDRNSGKTLWEQKAHEGKPAISIHRTNTYASETPLTDGQRVFAYFGTAGLHAFDLDGKPLWHKDLGTHPMMAGWGTGSSPALDGERLFVQCDNEEESFLVALDAKTGDELWRVARDEKSNWSTPYLWKNKKRTELVTAGGSKMRSYDPATGKLLWEMAGARGRCSATPIGTEDLLYIGVGGGMGGAGPLVAIHAGAEGELLLESGKTSETGIAWSVPRSGPPMASPLVYQDCVYVLEQRGGIIGCFDAKTGKQHYKQRIEGARGFTSSPWGHDGKVFCLDEDGQTFVLAGGSEYKLIGTNKLNDAFWSSVAVAGDHLLLRGVEHLYSIGK